MAAVTFEGTPPRLERANAYSQESLIDAIRQSTFTRANACDEYTMLIKIGMPYPQHFRVIINLKRMGYNFLISIAKEQDEHLQQLRPLERCNAVPSHLLEEQIRQQCPNKPYVYNADVQAAYEDALAKFLANELEILGYEPNDSQ